MDSRGGAFISQNELEMRLKRHLRDVLSIGLALEAWPGEGSLPGFLRERYAFMTARVLGVPALFLADKDVRRTTPAAIRKHIFEVQKRWDGEVIYVADGIDSTRRKQLIDQKVPFVVPGNQIFLPMLGVDLREHFRSVRRAANGWSLGAQAAFLRLLQAPDKGALSPLETAASLGYSSMSMSRAFDELEGAGLARISRAGKRRLMALAGAPAELWKKASRCAEPCRGTRPECPGIFWTTGGRAHRAGVLHQQRGAGYARHSGLRTDVACYPQ